MYIDYAFRVEMLPTLYNFNHPIIIVGIVCSFGIIISCFTFYYGSIAIVLKSHFYQMIYHQIHLCRCEFLNCIVEVRNLVEAQKTIKLN